MSDKYKKRSETLSQNKDLLKSQIKNLKNEINQNIQYDQTLTIDNLITQLNLGT